MTKKTLLIDLKIPIWVYAFIFYCVSLVITRYHVYESNQAIQLPLVELLNDPSLYPNDPFATTLTYYCSMLWPLVALCTRVVQLEPLLLIMFLIERLLIICASGYLAYVLAQKSRLAVIGTMALFALVPATFFGGGALVYRYFEQTGLSIPFFLLAVASFYKVRPISCAIWLSIGFNLNSMYGTYAITYFVATFLLDSSYRSEWKKWGRAIVLLAFLASPAIISTASAFGRNAPDDNLWLMASRVRFPHHLYPLTWPKTVFVKFVMLLLINAALLHDYRKEMPKLFKHGIAWSIMSLMWLLYAFLAAYIIKSPSMLVMHPGRGTDLWHCFAGITLISICATRVERNDTNKIFLTIAFFASVLFWYPGFRTFIGTHWFILLGLIALGWRPIWRYVLCEGSPNRLGLFLSLLVLIRGGRTLQGRLTTGDGMAFIVRPDPSVRDVAQWAKGDTPIEATFLVNPVDGDWAQFRAMSKRGVFVTWKDGSAILWDRTFVGEYVKRLSALGFDITQSRCQYESIKEELDNVYGSLDDHDVRRLMVQFTVRYWVVPLEHASSFPIAFQNQSYKVLDLKHKD